MSLLTFNSMAYGRRFCDIMLLNHITKIISYYLKKLVKMTDPDGEIVLPDEKFHLIQPVGISLHNVLCALSVEAIGSVTMLITEEVEKPLLLRTVEIANNEIRELKLDPEMISFHKIKSPGSETLAQYESVSGIDIPNGYEAVIGATGGTQRLLGMLLSRFGSERVLWVEDGPKAVLSIDGREDIQEIELEEEDFRRLYQDAIEIIGDEGWGINNGRLSILREKSIPKWDGEKGRGWKKWKEEFRGVIESVSSEINQLERAMGRLQFRYKLIIFHRETEDRALRRIDSYLGRLPKRVSVTVNKEEFIDGIEKISVDSELTNSFIRRGVYDWTITKDAQTLRENGTLHVIVGKYNSVAVANAISNHKPSRVCIWAISHESSGPEVQQLCNQAFTLKGWLRGDLPRIMGLEIGVKADVAGLTPPKPIYVPDEIYFINTSVGFVRQEVEEMTKKNLCGTDDIIDLSSGSGMISSLLHRTLSRSFGDLIVTHTDHYKGTISNLEDGQTKVGQGIGINDRLWLSQRPTRGFGKVNLITETSMANNAKFEILKRIAEESLRMAKDGGFDHCILPYQSWSDVEFKRSENTVSFSIGESRMSFHHPTPNSGFWMEEFVLESMHRHFALIDCISGVKIMTRDPEERKVVDGRGKRIPVNPADIEIDMIYMKEDGLGVVSCKARPSWNSKKTISEVLSWKILVGGPRCEAVICHSTLGGKKLDGNIPNSIDSQICWPETVGLTCDLDREEE